MVDLPEEASEGAGISDDAVVPVVPPQFLLQRTMLVLDGVMSVSPTPLPDSVQRPREAPLCRGSLDVPSIAARHTPLVREAQKIVGLPRRPLPVTPLLPRWPVGPLEADQPSLFRVQVEAVLAERRGSTSLSEVPEISTINSSRRCRPRSCPGRRRRRCSCRAPSAPRPTGRRTRGDR